ncbi:hypothetical protein MPSI1_002612 [Malassezia psittaci]|uniref:Mitochondrial import inner membrane translocase subunit Tim21 n=1 Tax=Malassezia psittaci TaxID=1821823 RepID=A0AAF0JEE9_9BASI|nr:hypothetical protein MPSI1_002612 [Malassezia psittaci]
MRLLYGSTVGRVSVLARPGHQACKPLMLVRSVNNRTTEPASEHDAQFEREKEQILRMLRENKKVAEAQRMQSSLGLAGTALYEGASGTQSSNVDKWTGQGKKWKELRGGQKVARATVNSSRFLVISFGAALTGVIAYALGSELFARNSPTVIYNQACKIIEDNSKVHDYLLKPYNFQTSMTEFSDYSPLNPPSHPTRPSQTVASMHRIDPRTGKDTLYLHFFVQGRDKDTPLSYWQTARSAVLDGVSWTQERALDAYDSVRRWWEDQQNPEPVTPQVIPTAPPKQPAKPWWITNKLRGLTRSVGEMVGSSKDVLGISSVDLTTHFRSEPGTWTEGEVHIEMLKDEQGVYQYKRFYMDVPNTSSPLSRRVYLDDLPTR